MKRIFLFLVTNIAVLVVISVIVGVLGLDRFITAEGLDLTSLLVFSAVVGFAGSIISLLISKPMAKMSTGARVIDGSEGTTRVLARGNGPEARRQGGHRHAGSGDLRRRAQRLRHRRLQELGAGRRFHRPSPEHEPRRSRSGARPRGGARRQRRHGHAHADPGRGEHLRHLPVAHHRLSRRQGDLPHRARRRPRLLHRLARRADRARHPRLDDRRLVLAPARVPRRRRVGRSCWATAGR